MNATLNGVSHFVQETGPVGAPAIVFVHAFPLNHTMWGAQVDALKDKWRVIAYDVRGFGGTPAGDGQYTMEFLADDLLALLAHLSVKGAVLCGLSMGGYIVLRAAEKKPDLARALVLCDTKAAPDADDAKIKRAQAMRAVKEKGVSAFTDNFLKGVFAPDNLAAPHPAVQKTRDIILKNTATGVCGALLAMATRTDTSAFLAGFKGPLLFLSGEHDRLIPPEAARAMAAQNPRAQLHLIPQAAHMSNLENPPTFNRHLLDFLAQPALQSVR